MANHPCKSKIVCDEPNSPLGLFSAEAVDRDPVFARFQMFLPPNLGSNWLNTEYVGFGSGDTPEDAIAAAMDDYVTLVGANNGVPPQFPLGDPPDSPVNDPQKTYRNTAQTCFGTCPDGLPFAFTVPAGRFTAFSQAMADEMAKSYACNQILLNRVCIGQIPTNEGCSGILFNVVINCTSSHSPLTFSDPNATLPSGLSLVSIGPQSVRIIGTTNVIGTPLFRLRATDPLGNYMEKAFQLSFVAITTTSLPDATNGTAYSQTLTKGGSTTGSPVWSILSGALPDGLALSSAGVISGTPTTTGAFSFEVGISDQFITCRKTLGITVNPGVSPIVCVTADINIPVVNTAEMAASSNSVRRLLSVAAGLQNVVDFIDTSTDTIINHAIVGFQPIAPLFVPTNNTFWITVYDGILNDSINKYDKNGNLLANVIPIPTDDVTRFKAFEPNTGKIYVFPNDGVQAKIAAIDPVTNAVTTQALGAPGPAAGNVFATPGFIFVSGLYPSPDASNLNIFSVPGYGFVANLDLTSSGFTGAFAYAANTGKAYLGYRQSGTGLAAVLEVNPATGAVDYMYDLSALIDQVQAISYDPVHGRLFLVSNFSGLGIVLNPLTRSVVCTIPMQLAIFNFDNLVCDGFNGSYYYSDPVTVQISKFV